VQRVLDVELDVGCRQTEKFLSVLISCFSRVHTAIPKAAIPKVAFLKTTVPKTRGTSGSLSGGRHV